METVYPAAWSVRRLGAPDPLTDQIRTTVAGAVSFTSPGRRSVIIPGGETVEFTAALGTAGVARTSPSVPAYLVDALVYAAETLAMTFDAVPGVPHSDPAKSARAVAAAFEVGQCADDLDALVNNDVSSAHAVGSLFRSAVDIALSCVGDQWKTAYGLSGFIGSFVAGVALWLVDGVKLVIDGVRAAVDSGLYWRTYRITLDATAARAALPTDLTGRAIGNITAFDVDTGVMTIDIVQYLADDDLVAYYAADPAQWTELVCDFGGGDYASYDGTIDLSTCDPTGEGQLLVNDNPRLRQLTVAPDATFLVIPPDAGTGAAAASDAAGLEAAVANPRMGNTYWINVDERGFVTSVEAQFFS